MAEATVIKRCGYCAHNNITHDFQDAEYGKFNRVFNVSEKGDMCCTVCNSGKKGKK